MALYTFALEDFEIANTRSRHEDTDQVSFGLQVGSRQFPIQDLHSLLPRFVLVESAKAADSIRAAEVCAGVKTGEIVIFDRAYVDFVHLGVLSQDGVFWVTRSKESLCFRVVKKLPKAAGAESGTGAPLIL